MTNKLLIYTVQIIFLLSCSNHSFEQRVSSPSKKCTLRITQNILPDGGCIIYKISNDTLFVQECEVVNYKSTTKIYSYHLEAKIFNKVQKSIPIILALNEEHHEIKIDGFHIELELIKDSVLKKRISIENKHVPELKDLFETINNILYEEDIVPLVTEN